MMQIANGWLELQAISGGLTLRFAIRIMTPSSSSDLEGYTFITTTASADSVKIRGMELEYSQSLSFLPGQFKGLNVRASYTRNYAQIIVPNMSPHLVTAGVSYSLGRANLSTSLNWSADRPISATGLSFQRHGLSLDGGGGYRLNEKFSVFFSVRNILNTPFANMQKVGPGDTAVATFYQKFGVTPTVGVKATF